MARKKCSIVNRRRPHTSTVWGPAGKVATPYRHVHPPPGKGWRYQLAYTGKKSPRRCTRRPCRWSPEKPREGNEGTGGPWIAVEEAGEGGGGFGLGVLGPGLAVAGEGKEKEGFGGFAEVGGWQEGEEGAECRVETGPLPFIRRESGGPLQEVLRRRYSRDE